MMLRTALSICFVFTIGSHSHVFAQQGPTNLVLAVTSLKGHKPSFQRVPWSDPGDLADWYARFGRVKSFQPAGEDGLVNAVKIITFVEGDGVRVKVRAMYGPKLNQELPVASYLLAVDRTVQVGELEQFGVEPFEIRLVKVLPTVAALPAFVSSAESVSLIEVHRNNTTLPSVTAKISNTSEKEIIAIGVNVLTDEKVRSSGMPRGPEGKNLIEPKGLYDLWVDIPQVTTSAPDGFVTESVPDPKIQITFVLFRDLTVEGNPQEAMRAISCRRGEKKMLHDVIQALENASVEQSDVESMFEKLQSELAVVRPTLSAYFAEEILKKYPALPMSGAILSKDKAGKQNSSNDADVGSNGQFDKEPTAESMRLKISEIRDDLNEWLARL